jgi:hypothetical protein
MPENADASTRSLDNVCVPYSGAPCSLNRNGGFPDYARRARHAELQPSAELRSRRSKLYISTAKPCERQGAASLAAQ